MINQIDIVLLEQLSNYLAFFAIIIINSILGTKVLRERKNTGKFNIIRLIMFLAMLSLLWVLLWEMLYENTALGSFLSMELIMSTETFSFYNVGIGLIVTLGLTMVTYANRWESFYYTPLFLFIGMFLLYLFTGFHLFLKPYIYISALTSAAFMTITGIKIRDEAPLGLAIFFLLALMAMNLESSLLGVIINLIYPIFGIILSLGFFRIFKKEVVN